MFFVSITLESNYALVLALFFIVFTTCFMSNPKPITPDNEKVY